MPADQSPRRHPGVGRVGLDLAEECTALERVTKPVLIDEGFAAEQHEVLGRVRNGRPGVLGREQPVMQPPELALRTRGLGSERRLHSVLVLWERIVPKGKLQPFPMTCDQPLHVRFDLTARGTLVVGELHDLDHRRVRSDTVRGGAIDSGFIA